MDWNIEGVPVNYKLRSWDSLHGVTLCCSILNEQDNLAAFLEHHKKYVNEIVIVDGGSIDRSLSIAMKYTKNYKVIKFDGHYANSKNRAIEMANTDWVLFLDPDERLMVNSLDIIKNAINQDIYDCFSLPRKNFVDGVQDLSHGFDYQDRLFRSYCRYIRPVHEELVGYKNKANCDANAPEYILHTKTGIRHEGRNANYDRFEMLHANEIGFPGCQTKETFAKKFEHYLHTMENIK